MSVRRQGIQQHPQVTKIETNTATEIISDIIKSFHFPNMLVIQSEKGLFTPEASCISFDKARRLSRALVMEPSGAVLLGMSVQHTSPNMAQTPPFSARSMSRAILFCKAIREVGASCSASPMIAFLVELVRRRTL